MSRQHQTHDPQQERLYEWERSFVEDILDPEILSRDQCETVVAEASRLLGIPAPGIRFKTLPIPCRALPAEWVIEIADWGRSRVTLLHEVAHLGGWAAVIKGEAPHGPTFLGLAIALYEEVLGLDRTLLERSATSRGLAFRQFMLSHPRRPSAHEEEDFYDGDF